MKYLIARILFLIFIFNATISSSQEVATDSLKSDTSVHQVFAGLSFSNYPLYYQSNFAGMNSAISTHLLYSFNTNLWFEAKFYHLPNKSPFFSLHELAAGYNHYFNHIFDAGIVVSRLKNHQNHDDNAFDHYTMVNAQIGIDWGYLYTTIVPSFIWQDFGSFFMVINNSRFFVSPKFGKNQNFITANPGFYLLLGRETWFRELPLAFQQRLIRRGLEHLIPTLSIVEKPFRFQTLTFTLPLALEMMPVSIELEPSFVINLNTNAIVRQPEGFFVRVGLFYNIL